VIFPDQAVRIVIATKPVDFRKGHDGLAAMAHGELGFAPKAGVMVVFRSKRGDRIKAPISFILVNHRLVTIRHTEPRPFTIFPQRAEKADLGLRSGETILLGLLEAVVDRLADILERAGREIDTNSRLILGQKGSDTSKGANYKATLEEIGRKGDLTSNIRDSLATLERLTTFLGPKLTSTDKKCRDQLKALAADVRSLADHANFMAQKIIFLLDATLGLISIEQNAIIKIFSVAAVVFLPPTLVASIYGSIETLAKVRAAGFPDAYFIE